MTNMPTIDDKQFDSPNYSARNSTITHILLHNTDGTYDGSISWLCNPASRVSAHLLIGRSGRTACLVDLDKKAWHAGNGRINGCSIGIELEATNNQRGMTQVQEETLVKWLKWAMKHYGIAKGNIGIHRWYSSTTCPGLIWKTDREFTDWRDRVLG